MPEIYAFTMAMVSHAYSVTQKEPAITKSVLDGFHDVMCTAIRLQDLALRAQPVIHDPSLNSYIAWFLDLLRRRYRLYQRAFRKDVWRQDPKWFHLSKLVLQCVLSNQVPDEEESSLVVPFGLRLPVDFVFVMERLRACSLREK
jgi:hypothetical protein